jgi:hypothetical protein
MGSEHDAVNSPRQVCEDMLSHMFTRGFSQGVVVSLERVGSLARVQSA